MSVKHKSKAGDRKNIDRAEIGGEILRYYTTVRGELCGEDDQTLASDLIADTLHYMAQGTGKIAPVVIDRILRTARLHFDAEHNNPGEL